jgi:hypothetical protein
MNQRFILMCFSIRNMSILFTFFMQYQKPNKRVASMAAVSNYVFCERNIFGKNNYLCMNERKKKN